MHSHVSNYKLATLTFNGWAVINFVKLVKSIVIRQSVRTNWTIRYFSELSRYFCNNIRFSCSVRCRVSRMKVSSTLHEK